MLEALEAQQPTLGTPVAVGAGVVGEAAVVEGVRGRTARLGDRHGRRARGAGGQVGGREVAGVGQGQSRSGAAGLLGGLDHRQQLGLVGWVLGDVRGGDQQPAAAGPGPVRAASFAAALGFALAASVFALLVANVLAFAASVFALLVADVLAAAGVPVVPLTDRSLERPSRAGLIADRDRHRLRVVSGQIAAGGTQQPRVRVGQVDVPALACRQRPAGRQDLRAQPLRFGQVSRQPRRRRLVAGLVLRLQVRDRPLRALQQPLQLARVIGPRGRR